jgi:hypothetical protein
MSERSLKDYEPPQGRFAPDSYDPLRAMLNGLNMKPYTDDELEALRDRIAKGMSKLDWIDALCPPKGDNK